MANDVPEIREPLPSNSAIKVHHLMCRELMKFLDVILRIFPSIESTRPRCALGMQALCSLNTAIDRAKLLLQHCSESSKLYLALTGDEILLRCERVRTSLDLSLSQIQNMVPVSLAAQISGILEDLRAAEFIMDSSEEEAGKIILALLPQNISSVENSEFHAIKLATRRLNITSPKAFLIEKRSIKNLLVKVCDTDPTKANILKYLLYLLGKYEKTIVGEKGEDACSQHEELDLCTNFKCNSSLYGLPIRMGSFGRYGLSQTNVPGKPVPPEEFRCPISSRLMHDPVLIASGQTFERFWIEKWFSEGYDTCPKTKKKLSHLSMTPNSTMKDLISMWCRKHGLTIPGPCSSQTTAVLTSQKTSSCSVASFSSSLYDLGLPTDISSESVSFLVTSYGSDPLNDTAISDSSLVSTKKNGDFQRSQHSSEFPFNLTALPWESQCKTVEDVKDHLKDNDQACQSMFSNGFVEVLIRFLKDASDFQDVSAQRAAAHVLLALVKQRRNEIAFLCEDAFHLLASFLNSEITGETLAIMEVLSGYQYYKCKIAACGALSSVVMVLDTQITEFLLPAAKILYNLSSDGDIASQIASLDVIPKLIPFLRESILTGHSIAILKNLCNIEEARVAIAESDRCIDSIGELLDIGNLEEQEHAVSILLSLCSQHAEYHQLVLKGGIIQSLVNVSVNGNARGKVCAMELLQLIRDFRHSDVLEHSSPHAETNINISEDSSIYCKGRKSSSKASKFFGKKMLQILPMSSTLLRY